MDGNAPQPAHEGFWHLLHSVRMHMVVFWGVGWGGIVSKSFQISKTIDVVAYNTVAFFFR